MTSQNKINFIKYRNIIDSEILNINLRIKKKNLNNIPILLDFGLVEIKYYVGNTENILNAYIGVSFNNWNDTFYDIPLTLSGTFFQFIPGDNDEFLLSASSFISKYSNSKNKLFEIKVNGSVITSQTSSDLSFAKLDNNNIYLVIQGNKIKLEGYCSVKDGNGNIFPATILTKFISYPSKLLPPGTTISIN